MTVDTLFAAALLIDSKQRWSLSPSAQIVLSHRRIFFGGVFMAMILVEPEESYQCRVTDHHRRTLELLTAPSQHESGWDEWIVLHLCQQREPILIMRVVNYLAKECRARSKRERERVKVEIIKRIGTLIRQKIVSRWKRRFVMISDSCLRTRSPRPGF